MNYTTNFPQKRQFRLFYLKDGETFVLSNLTNDVFVKTCLRYTNNTYKDDIFYGDIVCVSLASGSIRCFDTNTFVIKVKPTNNLCFEIEQS